MIVETIINANIGKLNGAPGLINRTTECNDGTSEYVAACVWITCSTHGNDCWFIDSMAPIDYFHTTIAMHARTHMCVHRLCLSRTILFSLCLRSTKHISLFTYLPVRCARFVFVNVFFSSSRSYYLFWTVAINLHLIGRYSNSLLSILKNSGKIFHFQPKTNFFFGYVMRIGLTILIKFIQFSSLLCSFHTTLSNGTWSKRI